MFRWLCVAVLLCAGYAADLNVAEQSSAVSANRALKMATGPATTTKTSPKKSPHKGSPKKSPPTGSPKKSPPKGSPKKSPPKGSPKKSPVKGSPKKSPPKGSPKKSPPKGAPKKSPPRASPAYGTPKKSPPKGTPSGGAVYTIKVGTGAGFSFEPSVSKHKVGDTIVFQSVTSGHNVLFTKFPAGVDPKTLNNLDMQYAAVGYKYSIKLVKPGNYEYVCGPHASVPMKGSFTVSA